MYKELVLSKLIMSANIVKFAISSWNYPRLKRDFDCATAVLSKYSGEWISKSVHPVVC